MLSLKLYFLGPPHIEVNGNQVSFERRKTLALLAYLGVTRERQQREFLATMFWPDKSPERTRSNLRRDIFDFNKVLGAGWVSGDRDTVGLNPNSDIWLDTEVFLNQVQYANCLGNTQYSEITPGVEVLQESVALYRGDFLSGFSLPDTPGFDEWQLYHTEKFRQIHIIALRKLVDVLSLQGKDEQAIPYALRWVQSEPLNETAYQRLMQLYIHAGQASAAIRQYQRCWQIFKDELGISPSQEMETLYSKALRLRGGVQRRFSENSARVMHRGMNHTLHPEPLPDDVAPFLGRERELAKITYLLQQPNCRLLFIYGPGGVGKTRLAVHVSRSSALTSVFSGGIIYVPLETCLSSDCLIYRIASSLPGKNLGKMYQKKHLLDFLQDKKCLLVLDDVDLQESGKQLISEILSAAPQVKILATGREALHIDGSWLFLLKGLDYPVSGKIREDEQVEAYSSVLLFRQLALRVYPELDFYEEKDNISKISQLVEGMPLALELAASWLITLTCEQIVQEIKNGLDIFSSVWENAPERHRSIRTVFEQSWKLLSRKEQNVVQRLAVFRGGFRREAAEAIASASLPNLAALVQKSIIQVEPNKRYTIHELLRQFIIEKSDSETGIGRPNVLDEETREKHCQYYLDLLLSQRSNLKMGTRHKVLSILDEDDNNIQTAIDWLIAHSRLDTLCPIIDTLYSYYWSQSKFLKGEKVFSQIAQLLESEPRHNSCCSRQVLSRHCAFHFMLGDSVQASQGLETSLAAARGAQDGPETAFCLRLLGNLARWRGDNATARERYLECLSIYNNLDDQAGAAWALIELGGTEEHQGNNEKARQFYEQSMLINQASDNMEMMAICLDKLGAVSFYCGEYEKSEKYYRLSLSIFQQIGDPFGQALALGGIGWNYWVQGGDGLIEAERFMRQSLQICREAGYWLDLVDRIGLYGMILNTMGRYEACLLQCQEGLSISHHDKNRTPPPLLLTMLAEAEMNLLDFPSAKVHLYQSINAGIELYKLPTVAITLYCCAELFLKKSARLPDEEPQKSKLKQEAKALFMFIASMPITWKIYREKASEIANTLVEVSPTTKQGAYSIGENLIEVAERILGLLDEGI